MKVLLRLLITALVVVGIGFGVYWIFFTVPEDQKVFQDMSNLFVYYEQEDIPSSLDSVFGSDEKESQVANLASKNDSIKNVVNTIYPSVLDESTEYVGTLDMYNYNLTVMKYYYRLAQFAESVDSGDVKDIRNLISAQKSAVSDYKSAVTSLVNYQDQVYDGITSAQITELANYYNNVKAKLDIVLRNENKISSAIKGFITKYVMSDGMENDAKGAMLDLLNYNISSAVNSSNDQTQLLKDSNVIFAKYNFNNASNFLGDTTEFLSAYKTLKKANLLEKVMGLGTITVSGTDYTKVEIAVGDELSASILNNISDINSQYFDEIYTLYNYLGF